MRVGRFKAIAKALRPVWLLIALLVVSNPTQAERLPIKTYTTVDGLANNSIDKIVRDSRGFLWFCTSDGLSRFDGYTFTNYGTDQGLPHREVSDFLETREGEFWVATNAGLVRFNPKVPPEPRVVYANEAGSRTPPMFTVVVPEEEDRSARAITVLFEDRGGTIWCGTYKGLYRLEQAGSSLTMRSVDIGIPSEWGEGRVISDLLEDRRGSLWVVTPGGLFRRWPDGSSALYTKRDGLPDDFLHALLEDHEGRLWASTRYGGFFQFAADDTHRPPVIPRTYSAREGMPRRQWVNQLFQTSDRRFWVATAEGLLQYFPDRDEQGSWFHSYTDKNGLSDHEITAINEDLGGNLWLGTASGGAMKLERNGFITYGERDGLYGVNSIFGDRAGGVCFRGHVLGDQRTSVFEGAKLDALGRTPDYYYTRLGRFDGQRFTWFIPNAATNLGWMSEGTTLQTRNGEWWVGADRRLYRFPATDHFDRIKNSRPLAVYAKQDGLGDVIYRLYEDAGGNVWVSTFSRTPLLLWEHTSQTFRDLSTAPGFPSKELVRSFGEDRAGNVWIGLNGQIARFHNGSFTLFTFSDGLPPGAIMSIYSDHTGRLWLASTRSGLIRVDDPQAERPRFTGYTTAQGLSSNSIEMSAGLIVEDNQGYIYVGTGRGLDRLDPATGHFRHFTTGDGLAAGRSMACYRDSNGGLWFGMSRGLSHFIPAGDEPPAAPPPILISGLQVAGSRQFVSALGDADMLLPDLSPGQNQLQIDFIGLSFAPGEVLRYEYMLEGTGRDWGPPTEQRSVTYRLAPGRYKFLVRAVNSDDVPSATPAVIRFRILRPVWARWWFLTLVAIGLTLILYRLYRYRVARLVELERVRTRIATDLHDDIGSSLTRMAILSEVAKRRLKGAEQESVSILTDIAESARGVTDSMSDIVWAIDPRRDDVRNLVFRIRQFASSLLGTKGIAWALQAPAEFDKIKLNPQQRRQLFLIFKEAINNSSRHADCNSVWLSLSIIHNQIIAEIRDDGRGMVVTSSRQPPGEEHRGHGLENIRMRAAQLGGDLTIDSSPGGGTSVRVEVPLKQVMA
jgi:ligand-binding sensor domain-containing protein/two-component sensor histidine kinase